MERDLLKSVKYVVQAQNSDDFNEINGDIITLHGEELKETIELILISKLHRKSRIFGEMSNLISLIGEPGDELYFDDRLNKDSGVSIVLNKYSKDQMYCKGNEKTIGMGLYNLKLKEYLDCLLDCKLLKEIYDSIRMDIRYQFHSQLIERLEI